MVLSSVTTFDLCFQVKMVQTWLSIRTVALSMAASQGDPVGGKSSELLPSVLFIEHSSSLSWSLHEV